MPRSTAIETTAEPHSDGSMSIIEPSVAASAQTTPTRTLRLPDDAGIRTLIERLHEPALLVDLHGGYANKELSELLALQHSARPAPLQTYLQASSALALDNFLLRSNLMRHSLVLDWRASRPLSCRSEVTRAGKAEAACLIVVISWSAPVETPISLTPPRKSRPPSSFNGHGSNDLIPELNTPDGPYSYPAAKPTPDAAIEGPSAPDCAKEYHAPGRAPTGCPDPELGSPPRANLAQWSHQRDAPVAHSLTHSLGALGLVDAAFERDLPARCMRRATGILLVQPPSGGRAQLASQLEGYGYAVQAAPSTVEALALLSARPSEWQLLLVDVPLLKRSRASGGSSKARGGNQAISRLNAAAGGESEAAHSVASGTSLFQAQLQARGVGTPFVVLGSRSQRSQLEEAVCRGAASSLLRPICGEDLAALWSLPLMHASLGEATPQTREADLARRREAASALSAQIGRFWEAN